MIARRQSRSLSGLPAPTPLGTTRNFSIHPQTRSPPRSATRAQPGAPAMRPSWVRLPRPAYRRAGGKNSADMLPGPPMVGAVTDVDSQDEPPAFPRLVESTSTTFTRPYEQREWIGDTERLRRIQAIVEDALEKAYQLAALKAEAEMASDPETNEWGRRLRLEGLVTRYALEVTVKGRAGSWAEQGDLGSIFERVEIDDIERIEIRNSLIAEERVSVKFDRAKNSWQHAVDVEVEGRDRGWVTGLHESLVDAIEKGKPRWGFVRRGWFAFVAAALMLFAGLTTFAIASPKMSATDAVLYGIPLATFAVVLAWVVQALLLRLFPGFEIHKPGENAVGARRLAALGSVAVFVLGSVVLPLVLDSITEK